MQEIELKFQVPAASRRAVAGAVAGTDPADRVRLRAAYFDTADRALARAGLALRVRREGRRWVQTLKGAGTDGMTRAEHNVPLAAPAATLPALDPRRHAGTPTGDRLLALLAAAGSGEAALVCLHRTDILRRSRRVAVSSPAGDGSVELAFDDGTITAGDARLAVCELEIELVDGPPRLVIDAAQAWVEQHGLWLDTRSKAERGDLLSRGERVAPPRHAQPVALPADADLDAAWHAVLLGCLDQIAVNASQVASGEFAPEHLHQLRVGLRRLRSALRLFEAVVGDAAAAVLSEPAAVLFRDLGAARDADAVAGTLAGQMVDALRSVGLDDRLPAVPPNAGEAPTPLLRGHDAQRLLLALLREVQRGVSRPSGGAVPVSSAQPLLARKALREVFERWHRQVRAGARRHATLDDAQRHRLRKRVKRLRYAAEFVAALYPKKALRRYLARLRRLQQQLGELNDAALAIATYRAVPQDDPRALFALGWLSARRVALLRDAEAEAQVFVAAKPFWRGKPRRKNKPAR